MLWANFETADLAEVPDTDRILCDSTDGQTPEGGEEEKEKSLCLCLLTLDSGDSCPAL